jgi:hypothetical protein
MAGNRLERVIQVALSFEAWMRKVDAELEKRCGMGHLDLPDYNYRDMYDDEIPPNDEDMLDEILEGAGF